MCEMKKGSTLVIVALMFLLVTIHARPHRGHRIQLHHTTQSNTLTRFKIYRVSSNLLKHKRSDTLQVVGSKLPDCTHACGSCTPCRLVRCSSIEEAETCPIAYKCMCHNKSYPVP
ncbi:protein EPIDERMAL PATTERNING FACTOR 1-like isoform X2 [Salvia divinorum]|uniref:Epidermal patterning factor-like protein n=1 Tax=Salvia divinorum TaxID=28513 RepID=A0ABD1IK92_SALDI